MAQSPPKITYDSIDALLRGAAGDFFGKGIGQIGQASLLALSAFASSAGNLQPDQHVYLILILILAWLSTVWLLREIMLGRKPKLRDGLYNSSAPLLSTLGVVLVLVVQLLPIGLIVLAYAALSSVGIIDDGFGTCSSGSSQPRLPHLCCTGSQAQLSP